MDAGELANQRARRRDLLAREVVAHRAGLAERIREVAVAQRDEHSAAGHAALERLPLGLGEVGLRRHVASSPGRSVEVSSMSATAGFGGQRSRRRRLAAANSSSVRRPSAWSRARPSSWPARDALGGGAGAAADAGGGIVGAACRTWAPDGPTPIAAQKRSIATWYAAGVSPPLRMRRVVVRIRSTAARCSGRTGRPAWQMGHARYSSLS